MTKKYPQCAASEAAKKLAGQEAGLLVYNSNGKKTLEHKFKFKDTFRNQFNRIRIDVEEEGDVIGKWMMLQYDVAVELARIGIADTVTADHGIRRLFLLNY